MARQYLPRANLIQGATAPTSAPGVSVPMQNPYLAQEAAFYNDLSQRLGQFENLAFKKAGEKAQAAGAQFGASQAPSLEQLELARKTGQPVQLAGDPSGNLFEQAAYKGSLAVTESSMTAAGRRALTNYMAEAAQNPNLSPTEFAAKVDTITSEYASAMANLSRSSGAKVRATLGMVANSQITSFSRTYMANQKKKIKDQGYADFNDIMHNTTTLIKGFTPDLDGTLSDILDVNRANAESALLQAGEKQSTVNSKMRSFDIFVGKQKIAAIADWGTSGEYGEDPLQAYQDLISGKASPNITALYNSLTASERRTVKNELWANKERHDTMRNDADDAVENNLKRDVKQLHMKANIARENGNIEEFKKLRKQINVLDPGAADSLYNDRDFGDNSNDHFPVINQLELDADDLNYDDKVENNDATPLLKRLTDAKKNGQVRQDTYIKIRKQIIDNNREELKEELLRAQAEFNYEPKAVFAINPTGPQLEARKNYKKAELQIRSAFRRDPEQDLGKKMDSIIKNIKGSDKTPEEKMTALIGSLPDKINTPEKLKAALADNRLQGLVRQHLATIKKLKDLNNDWKEVNVGR